MVDAEEQRRKPNGMRPPGKPRQAFVRPVESKPVESKPVENENGTVCKVL